MTTPVYTIGHSNHTIEKFVGLLKAAEIAVVADVRSAPYSRMNPQFNRDALKAALKVENIKYVFLGKELGARSDDKSCYINGQVQYDLLAETELFKKGIERVATGARSYRLALMCAEKEPLDCHRTILVARKLVEQGLRVEHLLSDGKIEKHEEAIERLIEKLRIPKADMLRSNDAVVEEAYAAQGSDIAYREDKLQPANMHDHMEPAYQTRGHGAVR